MTNLNNIFDAVYYINLPYRVDRKEAFETTAKYLQINNVIRFEAVNGHDLDQTGWPGKPGALGVRESHIRLLEDAKVKGFKRFIVFEDDAVIRKSFSDKLSTLIQKTGDDWDMLYLYAEYHYLKPIRIGGGLLKLQNTLGMVGVAYDARCLDTVLDKLKNDYRWVDSCMADLHPALKVYSFTRSIVGHAKGYSDNEGYVTYTDKPLYLRMREKGYWISAFNNFKKGINQYPFIKRIAKTIAKPIFSRK